MPEDPAEFPEARRDPAYSLDALRFEQQEYFSARQKQGQAIIAELRRISILLGGLLGLLLVYVFFR